MPTAQNTADAVARQSAVEESSSDVLEEVELNQAKEEVSSGPIIDNAESVVYRDQDLVRLQAETPEIFSRISVTETEEVFDGITVSLTTVRSPTLLGDTLFFVMHDEEDEAFEAMVWAVANFGGTAVAIENNDNRNIEGIDINGLFGRPDRSELNRYFHELINKSERVIALHNNWNHPSGTMHLNNTSYFTGICDAGDDVDDVLITGEIVSGNSDFCSRSEIQAYVSRGLNVAWSVYRDRTKLDFDCSSSCNFQKFAISYLGKPYFNLEAEHDKGPLQQKQQLCAILDSSMVNPNCLGLQ